jgi:hypothetical protein
MEIIDNSPTLRIAETVESLKLIKNTKGYNWEIKIIGIDINRLNDINEGMIKQYGTTE